MNYFQSSHYQIMNTTPQWYADQCARKYARRLWFRIGPHDPYNPTIPKLFRAAFDIAYRNHVKSIYEH